MIYAQPEVHRSDQVSAKEYVTVSFNGIWSWFTDPRAIYYEGLYKRTYLGWIDNYGNIVISSYDHVSKKIHTKTIFENLEIDDHNNPSILIDDQGFITIFFTSHLIPNAPIYSIKSQSAESIDKWEAPRLLYLNDLERSKFARINNQTYTHPIWMNERPDQWFLFYRGLDMNPSLSLSLNAGQKWEKSKILYQSNGSLEHRVPYIKVYSKGSGKIHIFMSSDHPSHSDEIDLYYFYFKDHKFYDIKNQLLSSIQNLPINQNNLKPINKNTRPKAWVWDVKEDKDGFPVLAYAEFQHDRHQYKIATFNGTDWVHENITYSSGAFTEALDDGTQLEPYYSGGIAINPSNTDELIVSTDRSGVFELEQWKKKQGLWSSYSLTFNSIHNNVRPVFAQGSKGENTSDLFWINILNYKYYHPQVKAGNETLAYDDRFLSLVKMNVVKDSKVNSKDIQLLTQIFNLLEYILVNNSLNNYAKEDFYFISALQSVAQLDLSSSMRSECQNWWKDQLSNLINADYVDEITDVETLKKIYVLFPEILERRQLSILTHHYGSTFTSQIGYFDLLALNGISKSEFSLEDNYKAYLQNATEAVTVLNEIKTYEDITDVNFEKLIAHILIDLNLEQLDHNYQSPFKINHEKLLQWLWRFHNTTPGNSYSEHSGLLLKATSDFLLNQS